MLAEKCCPIRTSTSRLWICSAKSATGDKPLASLMTGKSPLEISGMHMASIMIVSLRKILPEEDIDLAPLDIFREICDWRQAARVFDDGGICF